MIDRQTADQLANDYVAASFTDSRDPERTVVVDQRHTREEDFGWVYYYNDRRYIDTGDWHRAIIGNAPFIVDRRDGSIHVVPNTAPPVERYLDEFRQAWRAGERPDWPSV